jgi:hypothetical protein
LRAALDFAARRLDPGGLDGVLDGPVTSLLTHFSLSFSEAEDEGRTTKDWWHIKL